MMNLEYSGFDWDDGNTEKCQKHGISTEAIENFFKQDSILIAPDIKHSQDEKRYLAIGRDESNKPMFIVFTYRREGESQLIRPISARYMHKKEIESYEQKSS